MDINRTPSDIATPSLGPDIYQQQSSNKHAIPKPELRVLVVDDDITIREAVAMVLESLGCNVCKAENGLDAMASMVAEGYDLVVTDFDMPLMNGYRLSSWLKREYPNTFVVIMTALCQAEIQQFVSTGIVDKWLFKPFNLDALNNVLQKVKNSTISYDSS